VYVRQATGLVREISAYRAFILNLMFTSPAFMLIFLVLGQGLFPGAYLPVSSLLALAPALLIAFVYVQFSAAFPRSGGDYIFVGRILHPSLGFMVNFVLTIINISVIGVEAVWITTFAVAPMLNVLSVIQGNAALATTAAALTTPTNEFLIGAFFAVVVPLVMFFGTNAAFKLQGLLFFITLASVLIYIGVIAATSSSTFASNFATLSGTTTTKVIGAATSAGANLSFNNNGTLLGIVYTYLAVSGFWASTYVGGEVKRPAKSQLIGIITAPVLYVILMVVVALVTYSTIGHDFLSALSYLSFIPNNPAYTLPANPPTLQVLAGYATNNPTVVVIMGVGLLATLFAYMLAASFASVRCIFAWSFDSVIPTKFADVDKRFNVPRVALATVIVINLIFVYLTVYTSIPAFFTYVVTGVFIALVFVGLAAILFPYRRKDVFAISPPITTKKIGGVPLISILGALLIITSLLIGYASLLPALVGPLNPTYVSVIPALFIIGFAFYWISYGIQKSRGVPIEKIQKEIPPE
jgi:amino acid transporter